MLRYDLQMTCAVVMNSHVFAKLVLKTPCCYDLSKVFSYLRVKKPMKAERGFVLDR